MKPGELLADLQESIPQINKKNAKGFLLLLAIFACFLALFVVVFHFLPPFEEFKKFGYLGVFMANLLSSMGVLIPTPPGLAMTVAVAAAGSPVWAAVAASLGGTLGEVTAYYVGYGGQRFFVLEHSRRYKMVEMWMRRYGGFAVFILAFFPLFLFDFLGIAAGLLRFPVKKFLFFCYLGRLPRAFIEVYFYTTIFGLILSHLPDWVSAPFSS